MKDHVNISSILPSEARFLTTDLEAEVFDAIEDYVQSVAKPVVQEVKNSLHTITDQSTTYEKQITYVIPVTLASLFT